MLSRLIEMQTLLRRYLRKNISLSSNQDSTICSYHKVVAVLRSCLFSSCSRVKNASFLMNMPILIESRMKKYFLESDLVTCLMTGITNLSNNKLSSQTLDVSTCQSLHITYRFLISQIFNQTRTTSHRNKAYVGVIIRTVRDSSQLQLYTIWLSLLGRLVAVLEWFDSCVLLDPVVFFVFWLSLSREDYMTLEETSFLLRIDLSWVSSSFCSRDASYISIVKSRDIQSW